MAELPPLPASVFKDLRRKEVSLGLSAIVFACMGVIPCVGLISAPVGLAFGVASLITRERRTGLAITGIALSVLSGTFTVSSLLATSRADNELRNRSGCMTNLSRVAKGIVLYKSAHNETWPSDLRASLKAGNFSLEHLHCPGANGERPCDYVYLAPHGDDMESVVACDLKGNHRDRRNVLYAGMNVAQLSESAFQAELAKPENAAFAAALRAAEGP